MRVPVEGALVRCKRTGDIGRVTGQQHGNGEVQICVRWAKPGRSNLALIHELASGFQVGDEVLEMPPREAQRPLGQGLIMQTRTLGGMEQALVEFWNAEESVWLPWQQLCAVAGVRPLFAHGVPPMPGSAERLRLRNLAYALQQWHGNTGALSRLNVDPLPHQIHLVHRILASGNFNWLIADDVGLGKTIEVGLLISALRQRGFRRILLVVPAGLTQQWQEELRDKFFMNEFRIYGRDFNIHDPQHWKLENFVIGSVDRFKSEGHLKKLSQSGDWDLVVFDEAHRLGRSEYGFSYDTSDRYRLAQMLRQHTEYLLLLTGTPHQGKDDRFRALLELLRPGREWKRRIAQLTLDPSFLGEMVIRNRKADVTDAEGNFIFKGKVTHTIKVPITPAELDFDQALRRYLRQGYNASNTGRTQSQAIGFVMTTYRKLAASSIVAIGQALARRKQRLLNKITDEAVPLDEVDERYVESDEEVVSQQKQFFEGESEILDDLITKANRLVDSDSKLRFFMSQLISEVLQSNPEEKVVIFTEYRSTQAYLVTALSTEFGEEKISLINGGMSIGERRQAIEHFEAKGQFIVSTEAGGEGINLQRNCHIMVNFDLPWNPMRLVQRVGRLYRYGQEKPVVVFNVQVPQTLDADILTTMYLRLEQIALDMASVSDYFRKEGLREDILGNLVELLDVKHVLEQAALHTPERSAERLEQALSRAREAVEKQGELLSFASGYDPNELRDELQLGPEHLRSFAKGMFELLEVNVIQERYSGRVWELQLPPDLQEELAINQKNLRITFDRDLMARLPDVALLNGDEPLLKLLFSKAKAFEFGGRTATISLGGHAALGAMLRWQNERGVTLRQEYVSLVVGADGEVRENPSSWSEWLEQPAADTEFVAYQGGSLLQSAQATIDARLQLRSNVDMYPASWHLISAAWGMSD